MYIDIYEEYAEELDEPVEQGVTGQQEPVENIVSLKNRQPVELDRQQQENKTGELKDSPEEGLEESKKEELDDQEKEEISKKLR